MVMNVTKGSRLHIISVIERPFLIEGASAARSRWTGALVLSMLLASPFEGAGSLVRLPNPELPRCGEPGQAMCLGPKPLSTRP